MRPRARRRQRRGEWLPILRRGPCARLSDRLSTICITHSILLPGGREKQTSHAHGGLLHVPRRGDVLERNVERPARPRLERRAGGIYCQPRTAPRNFVLFVV